MSALIKERFSAGAVLAKAVLAGRGQLGLTQLELTGVVDVDHNAISRWRTQGLRADSKTDELTLLLVRIYRALYALFGEQQKDMCHSLHAPNHHLAGELLALMG